MISDLEGRASETVSQPESMGTMKWELQGLDRINRIKKITGFRVKAFKRALA
jgi:hypothetical protein